MSSAVKKRKEEKKVTETDPLGISGRGDAYAGHQVLMAVHGLASDLGHDPSGLRGEVGQRGTVRHTATHSSRLSWRDGPRVALFQTSPSTG